MEIELVHKNNFDTIKKHNLRVGTKLKHKQNGSICIITHIHSLYGWVLSKNIYLNYSDILKQDLSNIKDFEVLNENE